MRLLVLSFAFVVGLSAVVARSGAQPGQPVATGATVRALPNECLRGRCARAKTPPKGHRGPEGPGAGGNGRAGSPRASARDVDGRPRRRRHEHGRRRPLRDQGPAGGPLQRHRREGRVRAGQLRPAAAGRAGHADRSQRRPDRRQGELRAVARQRHLRTNCRRRRRAGVGDDGGGHALPVHGRQRDASCPAAAKAAPIAPTIKALPAVRPASRRLLRQRATTATT